MATFTIDANNNITAFPSHKEAKAAETTNAEFFGTQPELAKLTAEWPASRLVDTWNSFAGVAPFDDLKPVKKFTDRRSSVARIWKAVQRLSPAVAQQAAPVASKRAGSRKSPPKAHGRVTARKGGTEAREGSKKAEVIELMRRPKGATLAEIVKATGWQKHTVRGFVSGTLIKKHGIDVESFRSEGKERTYRIK